MKNKLFRTVLLALALVFSLGTVSFAADGEATISVSDASGKPGDVVEIQITVENNPGIAVAGIYVTYDNEALKLVEVTDGKIWGDSIHSPDLTPNPYKLFWINPTIMESIVENGTIAKLKFEILADSEIKEYPIGLEFSSENEDIINADLESVDFKTKHGKIRVEGKEVIENIVDDKSEEQDIEDKNIIGAIENVMTSEKRAEDIICLKIDTSSAYAFGKLTNIDTTNDKVVPYIVNDRTLVPLRFVSETLGADVFWEDGWNYCYVNKDDKKIKITFGSSDIEVNGKVITYEAPVQVVENRTMVPIRFISEELGYHVHWNQPNKAIVISPADNPWVKDRDAEKSLLTDILVMFLLKGMA